MSKTQDKREKSLQNLKRTPEQRKQDQIKRKETLALKRTILQIAQDIGNEFVEGESFTNLEGIVRAQFNKALKGDNQAFLNIRAALGEDKIKIEQKIDTKPTINIVDWNAVIEDVKDEQLTIVSESEPLQEIRQSEE